MTYLFFLTVLFTHVTSLAPLVQDIPLDQMATAGAYINFYDLMGENSSIAFTVFGFPVRWYGLAYLTGIFFAHWYMGRLIAQTGAPFARRHVEDIILYGSLGIILGGRLGYVLFYKPSLYLSDPMAVLRLWDGGMSFHGGVLGVGLGVSYLAYKEKINLMRIWDYVACVSPIGLLLGRIANFTNGELWGRGSDVPWAIIFPQSGTMLPRHPSQLYEALLEGVVLFAILAFLFWRTRARYMPGMLFGVWSLGYGLSRFAVEFVREPDGHLGIMSWGLTMGQSLTVPMIALGLWAMLTASRRYRASQTATGKGTMVAKGDRISAASASTKTEQVDGDSGSG